jgi:DNA recombination protein RmuC
LDSRTWQLAGDLLPAFLAGAAFGALLLWLWGRGRLAVLRERLRQGERRLEDAEARAADADRLKIELATVCARRDADADRLAWIHTADEQLRASFQALAGEALQQSSRSLLDRSGEQLRHLVEPVEKALDALGSQVREVEKERRGAYEGLKQEIHLLRDAHGALRSAAVGLEQALKSSAARGRWGEVQLRRVVEMAGLVEHVDFTEQATAEGLRPDLIVHLPRGGVLPIDAKAPMKSFLLAAEAADETARRGHLDAHLKALKQRTAELGQRRYWEQFESAPDFVVMFVPNEASLGGAFERDPDFLDFALRHRVLPATPVTLLALLKSVSYGWQQHRVAENARGIASAGRQLHDRLLRFLDHLGRLGKSLETATASYNQAVGSLERRVLPSARRLEEAGAAVDRISEPEPVSLGVRSPTLTEPEAPAVEPAAAGSTRSDR